MSFEDQIKELNKELKKAQRTIKRLEHENFMLASVNKQALNMREFSEQKLIEAKERAEMADQAKGDFLASMSHEIRTPINAVLGMNELILRESSESAILDYAADIKSSGKMLLAIINDILDFSKIESGKMEIIPVEYDLESVINDIINMLSKRASDKELDFNIEVNPTMPAILFGDEIRIRQIITNLLTNAIKYTDKGSIKLDVSGNKEGEDFILEIKVSDTGKGIKSEDIGKLFDSFTRVDEVKNRTIEGTGLGLALTKGFVDMMGGNITCSSVYGQGSEFCVRVRQGVISEEPIGNFEERIKKNRAGASFNRTRLYAPLCKVLVVDDVKMNIKVFCGLLKESGMKIESALSGKEALNLCSAHKFDIIFMDHRMPNMDGIECFRRLKEMDTPNNDTPVVALTANAISGMREMYFEEGFSSYLSKPIEDRKLVSVFKELVPELISDKDGGDINSSEISSEDTKTEEVKTDKSLSEIYPEINVSLGLSYFMNDAEFYVEMLKEYASGDKREAITKALEDDDYDNFRTCVHSIKSTSLNLGIEYVSKKAKALEQAAAQKDIDYIRQNVDEFMSEYTTLIDKIKHHLNMK